MARRSRDQAEQTRARIVMEATSLFRDQGYAATSIDEICARSGITKGALFHHFKNKKALCLEIWTSLQMQMDAAAREAGIANVDKDDPYHAFLAGCRVYLEWTVRPDYQKIVLFDGPSVLGLETWHQLDYSLGLRNMQTGVGYLAKRGLISQDRVEAVAILLQGALNGVGFALRRTPPPITLDEAHAAFEALVRAIR